MPSESVASNPGPKNKMRHSQVQTAAGPAPTQPADIAKRFTYPRKIAIYRNNPEAKAGY